VENIFKNIFKENLKSQRQNITVIDAKQNILLYNFKLLQLYTFENR